MADGSQRPSVARARQWALIVPREHGAWGLLLVPLFTGIAAGMASAHRILPLVAFAVVALSLFWLRTPVESLIGTGAVAADTAQERWTALMVSAGLAVLSGSCLAGLMWRGRNLQLLLLGAITGSAFVAQTVLRRMGRKTRMAAQLVGAVGLTCTAPAAFSITTGRLDRQALVLWAANWIFAANQIHFVQLRIHASRAGSFAEKFSRGRAFLFGQPLLLGTLALASVARVISPLVIIAFTPAVIRGTRWYFRKAEPLDVKALGWSEMKQGVAFGILLALALTVV